MKSSLRTRTSVIALSLALLVAACGGGAETEDETAEPAETEAAAPETEAEAGETEAGDETETDDGELEVTELNIGVIPISALTQLFVADSQGYFEDEGLTVELTEMAGGAEIAPAIEGGTLQVGLSNVASIALAHANDFDFQFLAGGVYQSPDHYHQALLVDADSDIESVEDLEGARIAVNTLSNINDMMMRAYLQENNIDPDSVEFVEIDFPDMIGALGEGQVDAAVSTEPFGTIGENSGATRALDTQPFVTVFGDEVFIAGYFASGAWIEENPNSAQAFVRAIETASDAIAGDDTVGREALAEYTPMEPDIAGSIVQPEFRTQIEPQDVQPWIDLALDQGLIDEPFDPAAIVAN